MKHRKRVALVPPAVSRDQAAAEVDGPWRFKVRHGVHVVATGVYFRDGSCAIREPAIHEPSGFRTSTFESFETLKEEQDHVPNSELVWLDQRPAGPFLRGMTDAGQDWCENVPFGSIGGLSERQRFPVPDYIPLEDEAEWVRGYQRAVQAMYGDDWMTCEFAWSPAILITSDPVND